MTERDSGSGLFKEAGRYIPGGVNSPVRSFGAVGGSPVFMKRGSGSALFSESGRKYIDYCCSWGALILGHAHPKVVGALERAVRQGTSFGTATVRETELAKLIVAAVPSIEMVRLTSSGTEAVMGAVRLARAYTGRDKIIKFEGCYQGHADYLLAKAGSGVATFGIPGTPGVPADFTKHTLVTPYNDLARVRKLAARHGKQLAAIIVEPVAANCGVIPPAPGFLEGLRKIADRTRCVLIFDEVITGFRLSYGGAQKVFRVKPDMTTLGKIIGGGMPIGAFGGRRAIMELLAPRGPVYQAGTLSGNPAAVAAGVTALKILRDTRPYGSLRARARWLSKEIVLSAESCGIPLKVNTVASLFSIFFTDSCIVDYTSAQTQDARRFAKFFNGLLAKGVYLSPSGFEANFISTAHTERDLERTARAMRSAVKALGGR